MSDRISQMADAIVALINAKPQSPTKAEIEAVIKTQYRIAIDRGCFASYPGGFGGRKVVKAVATEEIKVGDPIAFTPSPAFKAPPYEDLNEESLLAAIVAINAHWIEDREKLWANKLNEFFEHDAAIEIAQGRAD